MTSSDIFNTDESLSWKDLDWDLINFQKISENYYLVNQMSIPENKDFFKTLFQMDIDIEKSISETIALSSPILPSYFFIKFNNPEEETQFLLSFKNYKDKSEK